MMRKVGLWIFLVPLLLPGPGGAQEAAWSVQTNRGWIGLSVTYTTGWMDGNEITVGVIDEVAGGSPAEAAGIRVGDTLTHLDGQPISQRVLTSLQRSIEVGDLVRLTIQRNGRPRELLLEAAPQHLTKWVVTPNTGEIVIRLDSVRGAILESLDSLRLNITSLQTDSAGNVSIRVLRVPEPPEKQAWLDMNYRMFVPGSDTATFLAHRFFPSDPGMAVPFGVIVASSQETQQLREELKRVRGELTAARREELARVRELEGSIQGPVEEAIRRDERIRAIREREAVLEAEVTKLNQRLEEVSESARHRQFADFQVQQEEAMSAARRAQEEASLRLRTERDETLRARDRAILEEYEARRPLNYIMAGQSFVAGAQLQPLNPDLATYFHVEEGVLVTEVLEGTPASEAGLTAGDVIVRIGGERVTSLSDLRFGVAYLERPLKLRVVRKGSPMEIVIR